MTDAFVGVWCGDREGRTECSTKNTAGECLELHHKTPNKKQLLLIDATQKLLTWANSKVVMVP